MLLKLILLEVATLILCISALALESTPITRLDATDGNPGEHEITYITSVDSNEASRKTVAVILSVSGEQEIAYVYWATKDAVTLELISGTSFAAPKAQDDTKFTLTSVRVTEDQYDNANNLIQKHIETADKSDSPEVLFYNCISHVLRACDMKLPYRSPYRPPNLVEWVGDIPAYSRDKYLKE